MFYVYETGNPFYYFNYRYYCSNKMNYHATRVQRFTKFCSQFDSGPSKCEPHQLWFHFPFHHDHVFRLEPGFGQLSFHVQ